MFRTWIVREYGAEHSEHEPVLAGGLYERTSGATGQPLGSDRSRAPERTVLHELVAGHAQTLLAEMRDADPDDVGFPRHVERELAANLRCGILAHGFARVRCQTERGSSNHRAASQVESPPEALRMRANNTQPETLGPRCHFRIRVLLMRSLVMASGFICCSCIVQSQGPRSGRGVARYNGAPVDDRASGAATASSGEETRPAAPGVDDRAVPPANGYITMPDVFGGTRAEAEDKLHRAGLRGDIEYDRASARTAWSAVG